MIFKIFAVQDVKADLYGPPFYMSTTAEALRAFTDLVNDPNTTVGRHPGDFRLMEIGEWNNETGGITQEVEKNLGFASDYKAMGNVTPIGHKEK